MRKRKWKYQQEKESESTNKEEKVKVPTKKRKWKYQLERECREREGERPLPAACSLCSLAPWRISSSSLMMDNIRKYKWKSKKYVTCPPIESGSWALHQHFQQSQSRSGPSLWCLMMMIMVMKVMGKMIMRTWRAHEKVNLRKRRRSNGGPGAVWRDNDDQHHRHTMTMHYVYFVSY